MPIAAASAPPSAAPKKALLEFHSGFWINLHHFLYVEARSTLAQKSARDPVFSSADEGELRRLNPTELSAWDKSVAYYASSLAGRDLLFDDGLIAVKNALEDAESSTDLAQAPISPELKEALRRAAPIYRAHWWARHDAQNRAWIAQVEPLVSQYGDGIAQDLARIYEEPWPQYPVRVDSVVYANWAGAYTTTEPTRPTISSSDPANQGTAALEIVFHETSHGMIDKVSRALRTAEAGVNTKRTAAPFRAGALWHAVLFYTAGELVAERISGYVPYAEKNGLWARAWPEPARTLLQQDWKPHMAGSASLQVAVSQLAADLAAAPGR
ncbi:hypothetical protein DYQ86_23395 [Acidobacteria bacterium AB60]|nr:hypothetical protein DYQ86_23395 [Acidobacteria bacterium AB60]